MREIKFIHSFVISLIILISIVILYPINLAERNYDCELKVVATGDKNPLSQSSEVWILAINSDVEQVDNLFERATIDSNWISSGERIVATSWPASVEYNIEASESLSLRLYKHNWSGEAKVYLNNKLVKKLDLFTTDLANDYVDVILIPKEYSLNNSLFSLILTIFFNAFKLLIPILFLISFLLLISFRMKILNILGKIGWMQYAIPSLIIFIIYLLLYYPALMTADSVAQ